MTNTRQDLLAASGAMAILRLYGLDRILTGQDDPALWAAILMRRWPAPGSPDMDPTELRFGIAKIPLDEAQASPRSGLEELETWCFARVDADHLRVVQCEDRPRVSFMFALATGASIDDPELFRGRMFLDVSRPSRGEKQALVYWGISTPPNAGIGETCYWRINDKGDWEETKEIVSRWIN